MNDEPLVMLREGGASQIERHATIDERVVRAEKGDVQFHEIGPGKVLTSLNRRIERKPENRMLALEDGASIAAALAACTEAAS